MPPHPFDSTAYDSIEAGHATIRLLAVAVGGLLTVAGVFASAPRPQPGPADQDPAVPVSAHDFEREVKPLLEEYCFGCHGEDLQKGKLRLDELDPDLVEGPDAETWKLALDMIQTAEMPRGKHEPSDDERRLVVGWLTESLAAAARAKLGERHVVLRRLNKDQYSYSLQELLGVGIDFGRVLPADGKSKMGFSNNGEVLQASPLHLETYQAIARQALDQAIAVGDKPAVAHYRVTIGKGRGMGEIAGETGGYQSVPLSTNDFTVDVLDADGALETGATPEQQSRLDAIKRKISIGLRGSSQDRFHSVDEGLILYSALPHKEVAPGSWQGPSPNMKLELQRVFPEAGDFVMRVTASRGYLVQQTKELLVSLEDPQTQARLTLLQDDAAPTAADLRAMQVTGFGPWYQAGPIVTQTGEIARDTDHVGIAGGLDFAAPLADGASNWAPAAAVDGKVQMYEQEIGALYLARVIEAPTERALDLSLGSDDALFVWLNGVEVLHKDVRRGVGADQDRLSLQLVEGRNELVLKIVNYGGGFGSYHRVLYDGTLSGKSPFELDAGQAWTVLRAERSDERSNLRFEKGALVPEDVPKASSARFLVDFPAGGYYQFDLVHPATAPDAMGSIRLSIDALRLDLRPRLSAEEVSRGHVVTATAAGYMNAGRHEVVLGGRFFTGFSHLVITPLPADHPLVVRLEAEVETEEFVELPALRAYVGTRTDDGMDYKAFGPSLAVAAPLGKPEVYTFQGRLENLPIPEPESGDNEILSGIMVLGVWNDHLVKSSKETGPPLLIETVEFEAPYLPVWPPASHTAIFFGSPLRESDLDAYTRQVIERFAGRAFRRPLFDEELERYFAFWQAIRDEYAVYEYGVREVLVAVLCSPNFLYLAAPGGEDLESGTNAAIADHALATRLAYFLWNSPPDEVLLGLAREGRLRGQLVAQADRMLDDPRAWRFVRGFAREWLRLDRLGNMSVDVDRFPDFTRFVKADLEEETYQFLHHALHEDLSLLTLIDSDFAMLNQNLAEFYGVEGVEGTQFRPVAVAPEQQRGGLLAQGAFLTGHSNGAEPHPIKRAVWLKEKILGDPPMPPPPNVPDLDPEAPGFAKMTLKQKLEAHRDKASCRDCHASIDPYGVPFETFNAVGRLQPERMGQTIDASSVLPDGTKVGSVADLKAWLRGEKRDEVAASVIEHLFAYALGRDVHFADAAELAAILDQVRSADYRMRSVIYGIVNSPSFLADQQ
ncbi:MAG TPA: DUF1592 domain-containing protein [Planctomycetota bacterium]